MWGATPLQRACGLVRIWHLPPKQVVVGSNPTTPALFRCAPVYFFDFLFESKGMIQAVPHLAGHFDLSDVSVALGALQ